MISLYPLACAVLLLFIMSQSSSSSSSSAAAGSGASSFSVSHDGISDEIDIHAAPSDTVLLLPGRLFPLDFSGGEYTVHSTPLFIYEKPNTAAGPDGATALSVWDGGVVLGKYLEAAYPQGMGGMKVVEVGSGTGIVGLSAAALGAAHVILTDLPYALQNLRSTVEKNKGALRGKVEAVELDWFKPSSCPLGEAIRSPDLIVGADVVWIPDLIPALVDTFKYLTHPPSPRGLGEDGKEKPPTRILLGHKTRSRASDELFERLMLEAGFDTPREVDRSLYHARFRDADIKVLEIERRKGEKR
jgi:hypothetical protein